MYPDWQFLFWIRSIFWKKNDFVYLDEKTGREVNPRARKAVLWLATAAALAGGAFFGRDWIKNELFRRLRSIDTRGIVKSVMP